MRTDRKGHPTEMALTLVEVTVAMAILLLVALAVGAALGTGGNVYSDGVLRVDRESDARRVLVRILEEVGQTRSDAPYFDVGTDFIAYSPVVGLGVEKPTFGPGRIIRFNPNEHLIYMAIPSQEIVEELSSQASGLTFRLVGTRLAVTVSITVPDRQGVAITRTVTGETHVLQ